MWAFVSILPTEEMTINRILMPWGPGSHPQHVPSFEELPEFHLEMSILVPAYQNAMPGNSSVTRTKLERNPPSCLLLFWTRQVLSYCSECIKFSPIVPRSSWWDPSGQDWDVTCKPDEHVMLPWQGQKQPSPKWQSMCQSEVQHLDMYFPASQRCEVLCYITSRASVQLFSHCCCNNLNNQQW